MPSSRRLLVAPGRDARVNQNMGRPSDTSRLFPLDPLARVQSCNKREPPKYVINVFPTGAIRRGIDRGGGSWFAPHTLWRVGETPCYFYVSPARSRIRPGSAPAPSASAGLHMGITSRRLCDSYKFSNVSKRPYLFPLGHRRTLRAVNPWRLRKTGGMVKNDVYFACAARSERPSLSRPLLFVGRHHDQISAPHRRACGRCPPLAPPQYGGYSRSPWYPLGRFRPAMTGPRRPAGLRPDRRPVRAIHTTRRPCRPPESAPPPAELDTWVYLAVIPALGEHAGPSAWQRTATWGCISLGSPG